MSFPPGIVRPHTQTDASGTEADGSIALVAPGTVAALVVKVNTPVDDTLYPVTGLALKLKVNGIVWLADQVGVETEGPKMDVHVADNPPPNGNSSSVFIPPGFPVPPAK